MIENAIGTVQERKLRRFVFVMLASQKGAIAKSW
ncbi:MAG: hypothetical protein ACJAVT_002630 [Yoonia sp.]|jgi:hypothetical protein